VRAALQVVEAHNQCVLDRALAARGLRRTGTGRTVDLDLALANRAGAGIIALGGERHVMPDGPPEPRVLPHLLAMDSRGRVWLVAPQGVVDSEQVLCIAGCPDPGQGVQRRPTTYLHTLPSGAPYAGAVPVEFRAISARERYQRLGCYDTPVP
jgi:hypothetical protein